MDGALQVGDRPHALGNDDVELGASLIAGEAGCYLPIIYVSATFASTYDVDPDRLAASVGGMAHVVVEPNRAFSRRLQLATDSSNVYGGAVGLYWPDGAGRRAFFLGPQYPRDVDLVSALDEHLRVGLTNRRPLTRCTWEYIAAADSKRTYARLRAEGSREVEKFAIEFDKEMESVRRELEDANREIQRLRGELRSHEKRGAMVGSFTLRIGEQELYPGELNDVVVEALQLALRDSMPDSRHRHLLESFVAKNPEHGERRRMREALKDLLRDSRGVDARVRRGLEDLGFEITEDGKHHKAVFRGDDRYTFAIQKSGSDYRGGLNSASQIGRRLF